jgi:nucleotide-binding universal stress UspA family protein
MRPGGNEGGPQVTQPTPHCDTRGETKEIIMATEPHPAGTRIVVGVDGSEPSKLALSWAVRIAATTGASIDAVMAWHFPVNYGWGFVPPDEWDPETDATKCLSDTVHETLSAERPSGLRLLVRQGLPAKVLLDESKGATMLIVGSRGHGGFAGLLLGSVSANCAEHAECPVLVIHGDRPTP